MVTLLLILILSGVYCYLFNFIPLSPWFNFLWAVLSIILSILSFLLFVVIFLRATKNKNITGKIRYKVIRDIVKFILILCNTKVEYIGKENVPNETYVCYANHKSNMDIFLAWYGMNRVCSAIGKKSLFKYPIIKQCQYSFGCISLDRDNDRAAAKSMIEAIRNIKNGLSYIIFPEGGIKSRDVEEMVNLRAGAYKLVTKTEVPLLPCTIIGSNGFSKRKSIFKRVKVKVIYHKPITSDEYMQYNTTEIGNMVMDITKKTLEENNNN